MSLLPITCEICGREADSTRLPRLPLLWVTVDYHFGPGAVHHFCGHEHFERWLGETRLGADRAVWDENWLCECKTHEQWRAEYLAEHAGVRPERP